MIPLEQIQVAAPCPANWDEMAGTDQVRFCSGCRKNVYNLSEMTRDEAEALVWEKEGRLCVRFYTRADGTMLTQDCPVGLRALRVKLAKKLSYAAALLLSCGTGLLRWNGAAQAVTPVKKPASAVKPAQKPHMAPPTHRPLMGKIAVPSPKTQPPIMGTPAPPVPPKPTRGNSIVAQSHATMREPVMGGVSLPPR